MQGACQALVAGSSTLRLRSRRPRRPSGRARCGRGDMGSERRSGVASTRRPHVTSPVGVLRAERRAELKARPAVEALQREIPQWSAGAPAREAWFTLAELDGGPWLETLKGDVVVQ